MNQDLLDLILGELDPAREAALRARLAQDAGLRAELTQLEALFGFMRRGEEIEPDPAVRTHVMAEARRLARPPLLQRLRALPALFRFRFRHSRAFRVAAVSLGAHLLVMLVLLQFVVRTRPAERDTVIDSANLKLLVPEVRPEESFVLRLSLARVSRSARLGQWGVDGQREAIRAGVGKLLDRQQPDGSFGDLAETSRAALVLLAEGVVSTDDNRRGRALRAALGVIRHRVDAGAEDGDALVALVEDWALAYGRLTAEERGAYARSIQELVQTVSAPAGRYWADQAGFLVPGDVVVPDEPAVIIGEQHARGDRSARAGLQNRFRAALGEASRGESTALLTLQSPYRF